VGGASGDGRAALYFWITSGSFAMFAAIRRASSRGLEIKHGDKRL
jgi:hypothetical protein